MANLKPHIVQGYQIGQAAVLSGVTTANIRYYEKEKLIDPLGTAANGYRMYSDEDVHQLRFIRMLRSLDMSLAEVRSLLGLNLRKKADCQAARDTLDDHIGHVRERLVELAQLEIDLVALRKRCNGQDTLCHLIEALHDRARTAPASSVQPGASQFGKAHKASAHKHL
jgi:DNA-binding transcriptional MerR regulator